MILSQPDFPLVFLFMTVKWDSILLFVKQLYLPSLTYRSNLNRLCTICRQIDQLWIQKALTMNRFAREVIFIYTQKKELDIPSIFFTKNEEFISLSSPKSNHLFLLRQLSGINNMNKTCKPWSNAELLAFSCLKK